MRRGAAASAVGIAAFALYYATLLPGFDFGDTGFFQTAVGSATLTPRDGYPLYFGIANAFCWLTRLEPARALNLASAVEAAIACGLLVLVAADLSGSLVAAVAASLMFAASYTFWSQAIIAEVYALHLLMVSLSLLVLLRWSGRPTLARLAAFFAVFALGFGNHLSMVLLLPAFTAFLLVSAPDGWRSMLTPRVVFLATIIAAAGALQYSWNIRGLWQSPTPPPSLADALRTFWFDVTKSDWRDTMVLRLPASMVLDRISMYRFDLFQQFGWAVLLAPLGLVGLIVSSWRRALLIALLYAVNVAFAFTYNVGDTHVFYLPSHLIVAALMAPGIAFLGRLIGRVYVTPAIAALGIVIAAARMYDAYPALDRSHDDRPTQVMAALTRDLDDRRVILIADLNWQLVNGLAYYGKVTNPDLAYAWLSHVLLYVPALVRDNLAMGRDVALTERGRRGISEAYGPLIPTVADDRVPVPQLSEVIARLPRGTRYVLCVLKPSQEFPLDREDLERAVDVLVGKRQTLPDGDYVALAGVIGSPPALDVAAARPFRRGVDVGAVSVDVRMESWLAFDTIRRMGFGQVVTVRRRHALIVERGVSFVAFDEEGRPLVTFYGSNIFAAQRRYLIAR